ncbi:MAG: EI24 domain-containing protein [Alphaproteobacteria bacterium]|nr:EI24 domain-containing protein [Alphaproteobacteria bacterium]
MFASLRKAAKLLVDPALLGAVLVSLLLALALYAGLFFAAEYAIRQLPTLGLPWVNAALAVLTPIALILLVFFLGAPMAALFASLYLDRLAGRIEARWYPADPKGGAPVLSFFGGLELAAVVIGVDLVLLPADMAAPGIAEFATLVINGWLLGREYFELVARRHLSRSAAHALRRRHPLGVFGAGLILSLLSAVPLANLAAPLLGVGMMVHVFKRFAHEDRA